MIISPFHQTKSIFSSFIFITPRDVLRTPHTYGRRIRSSNIIYNAVIMGKDEYAAAGGSLKLKGVKDSKIDKKKKKKKATAPEERQPSSDRAVSASAEEHTEPGETALSEREKSASVDVRDSTPPKTEAERRYEEMKRKRLEDRLKREGVKTHKERVEELNKYLSTLSEHHDMPRIGPG